jgi:Subtilisin inhibitor-like
MVVINHRSRARRSPARFLLAVTGLITAAGLLVACGTAAAPGSGTKSAPKNSKVALSISTINGKSSGPKHWTLHCVPAGGTAPDAATACKTLLGIKRPFAPMSKVKVCPMILASSEQIVISGTWFGQKVHRVVVDGECDLGLFQDLHKVFY